MKSNRKKFCGSEIRRFLLACGQGRLSDVKRYLAEGHNPDGHDDIRGEGPMHVAAEAGHIPVVRALLAAGADIEARVGYGGTARPLETAAQKGCLRMVRFLVETSARINIDGSSPALLAAAKGGHVSVVKFLLGKNAELEGVLYSSVCYGNLKVVECLIKAGADVNPRNTSRLPLRAAARRHDGKPIMDLLLRHGANLRAADTNEEPLLHIAGSDDVAMFIIRNGVKTDVMDKDGFTALHKCASRGFEGACRMLLAAGADPRAETSQGDSVRQIAALCKKDAIVQLLTGALKASPPAKAAKPVTTNEKQKVVGKSEPKDNKLSKTFQITKFAQPGQRHVLGASKFMSMLEEGTPEWAVAAVAAPITDIIAAGKTLWPQQGWRRKIVLRTIGKSDASFPTTALIALKDSSWTIIVGSLWWDQAMSDVERWIEQLSRKLETRSVGFYQADTAGVYATTIYDRGTRVEYADWVNGEFQTFQSDLRKKPPISKQNDHEIADLLLAPLGILFPAGYPCENGTRDLEFALVKEHVPFVTRVDLLEPKRDRQ